MLAKPLDSLLQQQPMTTSQRSSSSSLKVEGDGEEARDEDGGREGHTEREDGDSAEIAVNRMIWMK